MKLKESSTSKVGAKVCLSCSKTLIPSEKHLSCSKCRYWNKKVPCPGCSKPIAKKHTLCISCFNKSHTGPKNGNWKGGGTYHKKGYLMRSAPGHPRARGKGQYVFEHILVVENRIGRYLVPGENIHHKNGVKSDNSEDNLELWTRPQPSGVRAKDALQWARKIIELYEPIEGKI